MSPQTPAAVRAARPVLLLPNFFGCPALNSSKPFVATTITNIAYINENLNFRILSLILLNLNLTRRWKYFMFNPLKLRLTTRNNFSPLPYIRVETSQWTSLKIRKCSSADDKSLSLHQMSQNHLKMILNMEPSKRNYKIKTNSLRVTSGEPAQLLQRANKLELILGFDNSEQIYQR